MFSTTFVLMLNQEENNRDSLLALLHQAVISAVENMDPP